MKMLYHNRREDPDAPPDVTYVPAWQGGRPYGQLPSEREDLGFLCEKEIRNMKRGSIIVNTARGPIIDEEAMIRALLDGCMCLFTFGLSGIEFRSSL